MKKLDKYILKQFINKFFLSMVAFIVIFILVDIIDRLDKFIDARMTRKEIIQYYYLTIPWFISIATPMSLLLSTVFTMSILQKRNEITALKASGISIRRLSISFIIMGIFISIFSFYFDNNVVTTAIHYRTQIENKYIKNHSKNHTQKQNIHRQINKDQILIINRYLFKKQSAKNISIQSFNKGTLISRLDSPEMIWNNENESWKISNFTIRNFFNSDSINFIPITKDTILYLNFSPMELTKQSVKPEEMNYYELKTFVEKIKYNGINEPRWSVNLHFKSAFACSSFLMILFGLSLSVQKPRSNMAFGIGMSIFTIFLYYAALKFGQSLGYKGIVDPFLSVWSANIGFFIVGIYLFYKTRT